MAKFMTTSLFGSIFNTITLLYLSLSFVPLLLGLRPFCDCISGDLSEISPQNYFCVSVSHLIRCLELKNIFFPPSVPPQKKGFFQRCESLTLAAFAASLHRYSFKQGWIPATETNMAPNHNKHFGAT